jgi:riboflavin biosynthesis pyrimidine reductase
VPWRTKVGAAGAVEHPTREAADAHVDELRARYRAGAVTMRLVRVYDPGGGVRLVDFARESQDAARAVHDLERATAAKDRAVGDALRRWHAEIARTAALGYDLDELAAATGLSRRQVQAVLKSAQEDVPDR